MIFELIEKKNQPVKTKVKMTWNEWNSFPADQRELLKQNIEFHVASRYVWFMVEADLLNPGGKDGEDKKSDRDDREDD